MKCHLHRWLLLPLICLLLATCEDDRARRKASEEARIKREVERRVAVERERLEIHVKRLHTVRVVGIRHATAPPSWCWYPAARCARQASAAASRTAVP